MVSLRPAVEADLPALGAMNRRMVEDERSRNPLTVEQLAERMRGWLHGGWQVDLLLEAGATAGYAVYQHRRDEYYPERPVVYVRHFFVERGRRRRGLGRLAMATLARERFPAGATVVLDVLATNPGGYQFWTRLGFQPYLTTMKLPREALLGQTSPPDPLSA